MISFKQRSIKFVICLLFLGLMLSIKVNPAFADIRTATSASLSRPYGVAIDSSGNLYIAEYFGQRVHKVDAATGNISPVAGNGTTGFSGDGGPAINAQINRPTGVAVDSSGNLYICDSSNKRIRKVDHATKKISTFAGNDNAGYSGDGGAAISASINFPQAVAVDSSGNLYIAQTNNNVIRKVDHATKKISTVAGIDTEGYSGDGGLATSAQLKWPLGMVVDSSGNLYFADAGNNVIRKVDHATKKISTVAGTGTQGYSGDGGAATSATLYKPKGVAVDSNGNLYIADTNNNCVRMVDTNGKISTVTSGLNGPNDVAVDSSGYLYIADTSSDRILTNAPDPKPTVTGISPSSGPAGTQVTISGTGFTSDSTVYINIMTMSTQCTNVQYIDSNTLTAIMPTANTMFGSAGTGYIYASNSYGSSPIFNPIALFTYTASITPAYTVTASPATATPTAGANNVITLTVQNSDGSTDTTFNGNKNVTVSGYTAAPDGSYGSFNGTPLTASPNTISVPFTSGVASPNLVQNNASTQTIGFSIAGVNTPTTNNVAITSAPAGAGVMVLTQDITAPAANGGQFAQQPKVTLKDAFGNISTNDSTTVLTASKKDGGAWTLTGTDTATASAGVVTFINLGASNAAAVTGAQLAFDATGLTQITSLSVSLPAPATAPSSDATLKATSTVKGQTVSSLGAPNTTLGSVTAGAATITAAKAADTTEATTFVTLFDKNDAGATVKAVKYAASGNTNNFDTDTAYTNTAITDGDFFIIKVTAADTTTDNYYKIVVTVTAAPVADPLITSSNANVTIDHTGKKITYPMYSIDGTDFTQLANIKSVISAATGYTFEIYQADGATVATAMEVTNKLKVFQGGNIVETYTFAANIKYGDVNGDGILNTADLTLLTRYILNSTNYPFEKAYGITAADINKDSVVNSADKVLLQRYLMNAQNYPIPSPTEFLYNPLN